MSPRATCTSRWRSRSAWRCSTCACASAPPGRSSCAIAIRGKANEVRDLLGECRGAFPEKHRQIGGRRAGARHLVEEIGDEAAVIARVVDDVEQDLRACHDPLVPADQGEWHVLAERRLRQTVAPGDVPVVYDLLLAPQLVERRVPGGVARREAVLAPFEVSLPDEGDHVVVIEGMDHVLEQALPLLRRFVPGEAGNGIADEL